MPRNTQAGIIEEADLRRYSRGASLEEWSNRARALLNHQRRTWAQARNAFAALARVRMRAFQVGGSTVRVQYNPGRFAIAIANLDPEHVGRRKCVLCAEHRPVEQRGLAYEDYILVINPAPIFSEHLTLIHGEHRPQALRDALPVMLRLAKDLTARYTVLYNGPGVGASSPDHLHLQVCRKGVLPIEHDEGLQWATPSVVDRSGLSIARSAEGTRCVLRFRCANAESLTEALHALFDILTGGDEPAVNVVCRCDASPGASGLEWSVIVIMRSTFRPS
ncbi:MAG TPA: DUF4922 domain-containing protein, partial [Phycisphaerae bacterium]|nr:DUF4922 domain-containing protein [Phycisphaerae bacterium]